MKIRKGYKILLTVIAIALVFTIGTSYALWILTLNQEGENVVRTDCFDLSFTDQDAIELIDTYPMSETEGSLTIPYQFTIKNICSYTADYQVNLESLEDTTLDASYLRTKVDNYDSFLLGSINTNDTKTIANSFDSRTIASGTLIANEEVTHQIRLWIDEDSSVENAAQKMYKSKVVVIATLNKNNHVITLNANGGDLTKSRILTTVGKTLGILPTPTSSQEIYEFAGWYSDVALTNQVTSETIVSQDLTNLYAKYVIAINQNGYNYWNDNYSNTNYVSTSAPTLVYPNYTSLVTEGESTVFIRTNYSNGIPQNHSVCLYYNNNIYCTAGSNTWVSQGDEYVKTSMANALGVEPTCQIIPYNMICGYGTDYCEFGFDGDVTCHSGSKKCYTYKDSNDDDSYCAVNN
ncbi:MAG: InlB B-repeat-containing protein [Bacilli bacterium]|nr:InlB B-repeat-containing protein [Bacilli bacterium]